MSNFQNLGSRSTNFQRSLRKQHVGQKNPRKFFGEQFFFSLLLWSSESLYRCLSQAWRHKRLNIFFRQFSRTLQRKMKIVLTAQHKKIEKFGNWSTEIFFLFHPSPDIVRLFSQFGPRKVEKNYLRSEIKVISFYSSVSCMVNNTLGRPPVFGSKRPPSFMGAVGRL